MKFWLKADIQFEAEDFYAACQRLRLVFAETAGQVAQGGPAAFRTVGFTGTMELQNEALLPKPEAKKK